MDTKLYYYSKFNPIFGAIVTSFVAGLVVSYAVKEISSVSIALVCGVLLASAFYIFVMFVTLRPAFDGKPVLIITEEGIIDRRVSPETIRWELIKSIEARSGRGGPSLHLATTMPWREYIKLEGQTVGGVLDNTIRLQLGGLSGSADDIEVAIRSAYRHFQSAADDEKNESKQEIKGLKGWGRIGFVSTIGVFIYFIAVLYFLYGAFNFPDGIRPCGEGQYCGEKFGKPHSEAEYKAYKLWSEGLWVVWPSAIIIGYICRPSRKSVS